MKKILRSALLGTAVGTIGLSACDATPPQSAVVSRPLASEAIPPSDTLVDVVRKSLADIIRDEDAYSRARRLGTLLPTLGPETAPAVQQTLDDPMLDLRGAEIELLVRFWATQQPEAAANWAKDKAPMNYHDGAVFSAISAWAQVNPQAAAGAVWPWTEIPALERIVPVALVRGWFAANDPPELRKFISDLPPGIPQQRAIAAYVAALIQTQGSEALTRWAESLPDKAPEYKLDVFRRVIDVLALVDIEAALRWCDTQCWGPYGASMPSLIGRNWVLRDGPAAMAWLSSGSPGYETEQAVRLTYALWTRTNREAALAWMAAQTTGEPAPWLRPLYPLYAQVLSGDKPADAIQWAERTKDPAEREATMIGVARVWRYLDEPAAAAWLLQSSLSEEAREKVRAPLPVGERPNPSG